MARAMGFRTAPLSAAAPEGQKYTMEFTIESCATSLDLISLTLKF